MEQGFQETTFTKRFDTTVWKKVLSMMKTYRWRMVALAVVMIMVAVIDAVFPSLNGYAIDTFVVPGRHEGLVGFAVGYGVLVLLQSLNVWLLITLAGGVEVGIAYDLRVRGFRRLQELSFSYFDRTPMGWIMARMTSDATRLGEVISWRVGGHRVGRHRHGSDRRGDAHPQLALGAPGPGVGPGLGGGEQLLSETYPRRSPSGSQDELEDQRGVQRRHHGCPHHQDVGS